MSISFAPTLLELQQVIGIALKNYVILDRTQNYYKIEVWIENYFLGFGNHFVNYYLATLSALKPQAWTLYQRV